MEANRRSNEIIAIVGPTATGKTAAGVALARIIGGEIISADSVAVYRGMDIGAAKPDDEERKSARFHLIDIAEPGDSFNVARFKKLAESAIEEILERGCTPIVVGGTGLYVRALVQDYSLTETAADSSIRAELDERALREGVPALHAELAQQDPAAAAKIHPNDRMRIVRALEVLIRTGVPISVQQAEDAARRRPRPVKLFGLTAGRDELYRRIDTRTESMLARGLVEEVQGLLAKGVSPDWPPMRSLGYKEITAHLAGEMDLPAAVELIKRNTRRFAKRQLTWFRVEPGVEWIDIGEKTVTQVAEEIAKRICF